MAHETALRVLAWSVFVIVTVSAEDVVVNTPHGALRGRRASFNGVTIDTFLGIPYGQAARFQEATPAANWSGVRDAQRFPAMCPQNVELHVLPMSEDCLYLNVYAPEPQDKKTLYPVMVWIHGGGYRTGTSSYYNGTALAAQGVVVVATNYRLDVLGFLSTEDFACPGNLGLLDQLLALQWVNRTIASFHGNPSDITIFGESAGGGSVSLLRLSPMSKGLFSKAIMESGVSLSPWAVAKDSDLVPPRQWAAMLGNKMGCPENTTTNMVSCLVSISADKLLTASSDLAAKNNGNFVFRPVVEQKQGLLPLPPMEMLQQGYGSDVISLRGVNKDEYSLFVLTTPLRNFTTAQLEAKLDSLTKMYFARDPDGVKSAIMNEYYKGFNTSTPEQLRAANVQMMTDLDFVAPTVLETQTALKAGGAADQFLYHFVYRPTHAIVPQWAGVPHASELPIVFGQPFEHDRFFATTFPFPWTTADKIVSAEVMTMWTNFAKYGNPTPQAVGNVTWAAYTMDKQNYLEIASSLSAMTDLKSEQVQFWIQLWNKRN